MRLIFSKRLLLLNLIILGFLASCESTLKAQKDLTQQSVENTRAIMELHETTLEASKGFYTSPLGLLYALCFLWITYLTIKILFNSPTREKS